MPPPRLFLPAAQNGIYRKNDTQLTVSDQDWQDMLSRARDFGYDVTRIERVPQRWPETGEGSDAFEGECR
jgi:hypothetical protein